MSVLFPLLLKPQNNDGRSKDEDMLYLEGMGWNEFHTGVMGIHETCYRRIDLPLSLYKTTFMHKSFVDKKKRN